MKVVAAMVVYTALAALTIAASTLYMLWPVIGYDDD